MTQLFIRVTNGKFHSRDEGDEYDNPAAALAFGVQSAVSIAAEEVVRGQCNAAVMISIEREDGAQVLCSVVAVSASPLMAATEPVEPLDMHV